MRLLLLAVLAAAAALAGGAQAQTTPADGAAPTGEEVLARNARLHAKVAAMQAEIRRVSRDPALPEEQRSARIDSLSAEVQRDAAELEVMVDRLMAARKEEARRQSEDALARTRGGGR